MEIKEILYEGKAKKIYQTNDNNILVQYFKDDATAFNGGKHAVMTDKGKVNNYISAHIMTVMTDNSIKNHFIERLDNLSQKITKLQILPLEVIVRNYASGSICKRLGLENGLKLPTPLIELCYKDDSLGDPLINDEHVVLLNIATDNELQYIKSQTLKINIILTNMFKNIDITLVDFKIEFGRDSKGDIILADEITPDSCRLWDINTKQRYDKDLFRLEIGDMIKYYKKLASKLNIEIPND
ncbi:MAG: phosphoribosylaminoimidazolesuccinocarboxamide synthase [Rickettsiales bacterium]|jgi:phosphoribosylaminoimidazole-succinocarboxamide synthase|nr:phosphoribosylaminoimidazolesuccinocarboxamide synthase [Rickettsiales bacterium]